MSDEPNRANAAAADRARIEIDRGRAGDKAPAFDPAAAPMGTDDEAAGQTPGSGHAAMPRGVRSNENAARAARPNYVVVGAIICVALAVVVALAVWA